MSLPTKGGGTTTHSYRKSVFSCSYRNGIPSSLSFLTTFLCLLPISLSNTVSLPSFVQLLTIFSVHPFFFLSLFPFPISLLLHSFLHILHFTVSSLVFLVFSICFLLFAVCCFLFVACSELLSLLTVGDNSIVSGASCGVLLHVVLLCPVVCWCCSRLVLRRSL